MTRQERLRAARKLLGLTQAEFAELLGVASEHICRWERGKRSIPMTVQIILHLIECMPAARCFLLDRLEPKRMRSEKFGRKRSGKKVTLAPVATSQEDAG